MSFDEHSKILETINTRQFQKVNSSKYNKKQTPNMSTVQFSNVEPKQDFNENSIFR